MDWKFSPLQVINGEVSYSIDDYRKDLQEEVLTTLANFGMDEHSKKFYVDYVYTLFYWLATNQTVLTYSRYIHERLPDDLELKKTLTNTEFLYSLEVDNVSFVDMLRAILITLTLGFLKDGMSYEEARTALKNAAGFSREV
ncbi:MAG: hypothetical protein L7F77_05650 [Candidatus Magnetominusculus sp. LBB02]|nr:hypothetical protein [Candidatus Magnetominusculus sp. LBB02]